jgi:hypothetical protein
MRYSLDILDANNTIADLQESIRQTERLAYRLVSISTGFAGGAPASLVTFSQAAAKDPPAPISLTIIDGNLSKDQQEAKLNETGKQLISYGSLYVQGHAQNVLAYRATT